MTGALKKGVVLLVLVFLGFYMFTDPQGLAATAKDAGTMLWDGLTSLFDALIKFVNSLKDK